MQDDEYRHTGPTGGDFRRVRVWSGWLRLAHAALAVATLLLLGTGWLIGHAPSLAEGASDYHYLAASLLLFGLTLRAWLLFFGDETARLGQLMPGPGEGRRIRETLLFYLTLGRRPLPAWYAHNPLWKPLYFMLLLVLLLMVLTGGFMQAHPLVWRVYLPAVHDFWAGVVGWFVLLHVLTAVWHDWRSERADVSAIVNGWKLFPLDPPSPPPIPQDDVVGRIRLETLRAELPRARDDEG